MFLKYQMALCIVLATLILPPISILLIQRVMRPMQKLSDSMQQMEKGNLNQCVTEIPHNELGVLIRQYNRMAQSIQQLTWQNNQIADEKRLTEVQALQAYINPHFLYNTILTLRWMAIMVQANNLADAMTAFGSMLKPLYDTNEAMWTLAEERAFLENYIRIMNYRYGNGVQISIDLPAELSEYKILKFIVQQLVENAFSYGIHTDTCTGQIDICFEKDEDALRIQVTDHGEGMSNERLSQLRNALKEEVRQYGSHGMALPNMARRLRLYYGTGSHLTVDSDKQGTCVKMVLPFSSDEVSKG